jgi:hypothetical protein
MTPSPVQTIVYTSMINWLRSSSARQSSELSCRAELAFSSRRGRHFAVRRGIVVTEGNSARILAVAMLTYATPSSKDTEHRSLIVFESSKRPDLDVLVNELGQFVGHELHQETALYGQRLFKAESSHEVFIVLLNSK